MSKVSDEKLAESWHELMGRYNQLTCRLDRELSAQHDLSSSEFEVLQLLHNAEGKVRMAFLAEQVHLSQSALSRLVTRLENDGLVCRNTCADDRRAQWTEITPEGRDALQGGPSDAPQDPPRGSRRMRPARGRRALARRPLSEAQSLVPALRRLAHASAMRDAMPASAALPQARGSYAFLLPTSPSTLRTPS